MLDEKVACAAVSLHWSVNTAVHTNVVHHVLPFIQLKYIMCCRSHKCSTACTVVPFIQPQGIMYCRSHKCSITCTVVHTNRHSAVHYVLTSYYWLWVGVCVRACVRASLCVRVCVSRPRCTLRAACLFNTLIQQGRRLEMSITIFIIYDTLDARKCRDLPLGDILRTIQ